MYHLQGAKYAKIKTKCRIYLWQLVSNLSTSRSYIFNIPMYVTLFIWML
jgi:hypothetical protein